MIEKIFITVLVLYALFVAIYFLWIRLNKKRKKDIVGKGSSIQKTEHLKAYIVGKSRFDLSASKPLVISEKPLTVSPPKSESREEYPDTFVPSSDAKPSVEVPQEELDELFSDSYDKDDNEPMDIDFSLEYEDEQGDEEEEVVEGTAQAMLASGVRFEELGNAVRTVNRTNEATSEQKRKAGNTLLEIRQTDMFEQLVSAKPDAKRIVTELMNESLSAFYERKGKEDGTTESSKKVPDDFNIRDFI